MIINGIDILCLICKKSFYIYPYQVNKRKYCSKLCSNKAALGKSVSEETRRKIGIAHKGAIFSKERRDKIRQKALGRKGHKLGKLFEKGNDPWNKGLKGINLGSKNWMWKGENAGYHAIHIWLKTNYGKASKCEHCGTKKAKRFEWANISGEYKRDISDYLQLCSKCHHKYDNLSQKRWETRRGSINYARTV